MHGLDSGDGVRSSPQYAALTKYIPQLRRRHHLFHRDAAPDDAGDNLTDTLRAFCTPAEERFAAAHHDPAAMTAELALGWQAVIAHATGLGHAVLGTGERDRLVTFLLELARFDRVDGVPCEIPGERGRVWLDLPLLYDEVRQAWDYAPGRDSSSQHQLRWASLNAFVATLTTRAGPHTSDNLDFSLLGLWTVSTALEPSSGGDGGIKPGLGALEAAASWLVLAPAALWAHCREGRHLDANGDGVPPFKPGDSMAFSEERWHGWEDSLKKLEDKHSGETMGKLLKQAIKSMHRAQRD